VRDGALKFDLVELRQLKKSDARRLQALLIKDRAWLSPWEATTPGIRYPVDARDLVRNLLYQQRKGTGLAFIIEVDGVLAGQINVANILYGSVSSATVGYWIGKYFAGRGAMPIAVALTIDYLFDELGLHRVEIDIRPENEASLRVVEKLKLREEGLKERFIHIDGQWRDHRVFAITSEERKGSMLGRLDNTLDQ
jgi:ribosomal-protein-alanine N-acetyltransferase